MKTAGPVVTIVHVPADPSYAPMRMFPMAHLEGMGTKWNWHSIPHGLCLLEEWLNEQRNQCPKRTT